MSSIDIGRDGSSTGKAMSDDAVEKTAFVAQCKNGLCAGTYATEGRKLTLNSDFGSQSTILGLQKPEKLARKMLKRLCDTSSTGSGDPRLLRSRPRVSRCVQLVGMPVAPGIIVAEQESPTNRAND